MKDRKLVAALACRAGGTRLFGKPLQQLDSTHTILSHLVGAIKQSEIINTLVLGISEGIENEIFIEFANQFNCDYIIGDEKDVLSRLISCGEQAEATDIFRITSESPFTAWEFLPKAWENHLKNNNDITITEFLPEGMNFEIFTIESLKTAHQNGKDSDRSEFCSAYHRRNHRDFIIQLIEPPTKYKRLDLRFTVDNPEDLVLCRKIYSDLMDGDFHMPIEDIINWADRNDEWRRLVDPFVDGKAIWAHVIDE